MAAATFSSSVRAASFVVTGSEDEPDTAPGDGLCASEASRCTLRAAIEETNADFDFDTVYVSPARYVLSRGALVLSGQVEVFGGSADSTIIDARLTRDRAGPARRSVRVRSFEAVTLVNGYAGAPGERGGAVLIPDAEALFGLDRAVVRDSFAASGGGGGGIYNAGNLDIARAAIVDNESDARAAGDWEAAGGGIYNSGSVYIQRSAILDNLHMTEEGWGRTQGAELDASRLRVVDDGRVDSSLIGDVEVTDGGAKLGWGVPATSDAFQQAELADAPGRWAIFGYDSGALLANGSRAPGPRVAFFRGRRHRAAHDQRWLEPVRRLALRPRATAAVSGTCVRGAAPDGRFARSVGCRAHERSRSTRWMPRR